MSRNCQHLHLAVGSPKEIMQQTIQDIDISYKYRMMKVYSPPDEDIFHCRRKQSTILYLSNRDAEELESHKFFAREFSIVQ